MKLDSSRAFGAYSATMTLTVIWLLFGSVTQADEKAFQTIDVQRINVRESDGTLRMTIASRDRMPGIIIAGREIPHPDRRQAGLIFYNDEGSENGGLIFSGSLQHGRPTNLGALSFDRWRQDQTVSLSSTEEGADRQVGLAISDRPDRPVDFDSVARLVRGRSSTDRDAKIAAAGAGVTPRVYLGRTLDRSSVLALRDASGRKRIELRVSAGGKATIQFLDVAGRVSRSIEGP